MSLREHPRRKERKIFRAARYPGRPQDRYSSFLRVSKRKVLDVAGIKWKPPLQGKLSLTPCQKVQCSAGVIGRVSQHNPAEEIRNQESRVKADNCREKIGEMDVIVRIHLPVPGNLHRLQPDEIPEEVPESER